MTPEQAEQMLKLLKSIDDGIRILTATTVATLNEVQAGQVAVALRRAGLVR